MPSFTPLRLLPAAAVTARVPTWATVDANTLTVTTAFADGNDVESWDAEFGTGTFDQSTVADRPHLETTDVDGLTMIKSVGTEHLAYTPSPSGGILTFAITIKDYGDGSPRRVLAIDTDSGTVTDKAAVEFFFEDVSI